MSSPSARRRSGEFELIDRISANSNWNGSPMTLLVNQNVVMPQTANGTMIIGYFNQSQQNNGGVLSITSGGGQPCVLNVPAGALQPFILIKNWGANNLSITNISPNQNTPMWIAAFGPGIPGQYPLSLQVGTAVPLAPAQSAQGNALPQWMQLNMQSNSPALTIFAFTGGPPDSTGNNGYVVAVNAAANTGPGAGVQPPPGYYATTTSNAFPYSFNWGSSLVYVVNMSPAMGSGAQVTMRAL